MRRAMALGSDTASAAEASAAGALHLFGGVFAWIGPRDRPQDALSVAVALDRRPWARVEAAASGVRVESKDALLRLEAPSVADLPASGLGGLVRTALLELGIEGGLRISTQSRVPWPA